MCEIWALSLSTMSSFWDQCLRHSQAVVSTGAWGLPDPPQVLDFEARVESRGPAVLGPGVWHAAGTPRSCLVNGRDCALHVGTLLPSSSLSLASTPLKGRHGADSPGQACPCLSSRCFPGCSFNTCPPPTCRLCEHRDRGRFTWWGLPCTWNRECQVRMWASLY